MLKELKPHPEGFKIVKLKEKQVKFADLTSIAPAVLVYIHPRVRNAIDGSSINGYHIVVEFRNKHYVVTAFGPSGIPREKEVRLEPVDWVDK